MTDMDKKREEIREGIDATICMFCEEDVDKRVCSEAICGYASGLRDALTKKLHSQGVVIKVDRCPVCGEVISSAFPGKEWYHCPIVSCGWTGYPAVEPLI